LTEIVHAKLQFALFFFFAHVVIECRDFFFFLLHDVFGSLKWEGSELNFFFVPYLFGSFFFRQFRDKKKELDLDSCGQILKAETSKRVFRV
jgi:hypothetical protein